MTKNIHSLCGIIFLATASTVPIASAEESGACRLELPDLICAKSLKDGKAILSAMASSESRLMLEAAQKGPIVFTDSDQREAYRISLERNRNSMKRYADRSFRNYKRRRLSAEDYEAISKQFESGMVTYREGMELYREGTWSYSNNSSGATE